MRLRGALTGATCLLLPVLAYAQAETAAPIGYPVSGFYVGAAGGFNVKGNESVKNISSNLALGTGVSTPNLTLNSSLGGAANVVLGWGFGNGLRVELEGAYRGNSINGASGVNRSGFGASTSGTGSERVYGPMVNVLYDLVGVVPYVIPYVGVGGGYQWAHLHNLSITGSGSAAALNPVFSSNSNKGAAAVQGILGVAYPIPQVLGLSLTAQYEIMALLGNRTYNAGLAVTGPTGVRRNAFGTFQLGHQYNNTFLFGIRYNFGVTPPPPPPAPVAAPAPAPARSYLVFFDWDSAALTERAREIIKEAAENSTHVQYTRIEVNGYTDTSGTPRYNQRLSVRRAQNVAAELVRDGVPESAITIQGFGETHLLVPTGPGVREPQNRRVEIIIK